jgi:hypothetical protein
MFDGFFGVRKRVEREKSELEREREKRRNI